MMSSKQESKEEAACSPPKPKMQKLSPSKIVPKKKPPTPRGTPPGARAWLRDLCPNGHRRPSLRGLRRAARNASTTHAACGPRRAASGTSTNET